MLNEEHDFELMDQSRETLEKLQNKKENERRDPLQEYKETKDKVDRASDLYEEYDKKSFENKFNVDMIFYEQLLEKLDEDSSESVEKIFSSLYKTVNKIYEFVNMKPEVYGGIQEDILEESIENRYRQISKIIYEYLDHNFYKLDPQKRTDMYLDSSREIAKDLISEGEEVDESLAYSTKVVVMEGLVKKIAFPFSVMSRINYLTEDIEYGKVFDQQELNELVEQFHKSARNLAKVVSACV